MGDAFLQDFSKRMELMACFSSILCRRNRNMEIENHFQRDGEMDALILAVLLFIKQNTLTETPVGLEEIANFIYQARAVGGNPCTVAFARETAGYIVRDILQNKGKALDYATVDLGAGGKAASVHIRLIMDKEVGDRKIVYELTEQGYAFIFSTLENAQNMTISMEGLILQEYLRLKNYSEAEQVSTQIYTMIQQEIQRVTEMRIRIRRNLFSVEYADFAAMFRQVCSRLKDEQKRISELQTVVRRTEERIQKDVQIGGKQTDDEKEALKSLAFIRKNLEKVYQAQVNLIGDTQEVSQIYEEALENSLRAQVEYRYDFQKEVMDKIPTIRSEEQLDSAIRLIIPFLKPSAKKLFQLEMPYGKQSSILFDDDDNDEPVDTELLDEESDHEQERLAIERNDRHAAILDAIMKCVANRPEGATTEDILNGLGELDNEQQADVLRDMAYLYQIGTIGLTAWKNHLNEVIQAEGSGEFDLDNALLRIYHHAPDFYGLDALVVEKTGETFTIRRPVEDETGLVNITEMDMLRFRAGKEANT